NVVLDLSLNGGGSAHAAACVLSWMLGDASTAILNKLSGAKICNTYQTNVNLDGDFDDKDYLTDVNLFCLVTPVSFSCGNAVPVYLKESGRVTIMGVKTGGGSCMVLDAISPSGTLFTLSSFNNICINKNGSFYDVDQGVEPDVRIAKKDNYYDIEKLSSIVENLK
nr:hypothetical protein [Treponema sp.]